MVSDQLVQPRVVTAGRVRVPDEPSVHLDVTFRLEGETLTLHAGEEELGAWNVAATTFRRRTSRSYEFAADGDVLLFQPADEPDFAVFERELVSRRVSEKKAKRRRTLHTNHVDTRTASSSVVSRPSPPPGVVEQTPRPPASAAQPQDESRLAEPGAPGVLASHASRAAVSIKRGTRLAGLWAIDHLRQTDIFGLDRLPVVTDEMRLGRGHVHTFERRVGAVGLSRLVCPGCGTVRVSAD